MTRRIWKLSSRSMLVVAALVLGGCDASHQLKADAGQSPDSGGPQQRDAEAGAEVNADGTGAPDLTDSCCHDLGRIDGSGDGTAADQAEQPGDGGPSAPDGLSIDASEAGDSDCSDVALADSGLLDAYQADGQHPEDRADVQDGAPLLAGSSHFTVTHAGASTTYNWSRQQGNNVICQMSSARKSMYISLSEGAEPRADLLNLDFDVCQTQPDGSGTFQGGTCTSTTPSFDIWWHVMPPLVSTIAKPCTLSITPRAAALEIEGSFHCDGLRSYLDATESNTDTTDVEGSFACTIEVRP